MCSTALLALLAPIQYTFTNIPQLPPQLIDYIEVFSSRSLDPQAPTPYLIGIYSPTLAKHAFDADSLALLVHLDFDKVFLSLFPLSQLSYPPSAVIRPLPIPRNALLTSPKPLRCPPAVSRLIP